MLAPLLASPMEELLLKKGQLCWINCCTSWNSVFFGGIPSGQSVLAVPENFKFISFIFTGLVILRNNDPLNNSGGLSLYSFSSNPCMNNVFSARIKYNRTDPEWANGLGGNLMEVSDDNARSGNNGDLTPSIMSRYCG